MYRKVKKTNSMKRIISGALVFVLVMLLSTIDTNSAISSSVYTEIGATILYFEQDDIIFEKTVETGTTLEELGLPTELRAVIETARENNSDDVSNTNDVNNTDDVSNTDCENSTDSLRNECLTATSTSLSLIDIDQNSESSLVVADISLSWEGYYGVDSPGVYTLLAQAYGYVYNCDMPTAIVTVVESAAEDENAGMPLVMDDMSAFTRDVEFDDSDMMFCEKNAYINGSKTAENGTESAPVRVRAGDKIRYSITTGYNKLGGSLGAGFDVLFVLDWSTSMGAEMMSGKSARQYERDVMLDMSSFMLESYPNNRVAVLGMNSSPGLNNNPDYTNIQFQTDFLNKAQFKAELPNIKNAFNDDSEYPTEDLVSFLKAANFKLEGETVAFGSKLPTRAKYTIPRDSSTRTPVIFLISDFQIPRSHNNSNYWESYMKGQADRFEAKSNGGILHTVRFDHKGNVPPSSNADYSSAKNDKAMQDFVSPAGRSHWGFTKVRVDTPYTEALGHIKSDFLSLLSLEEDFGPIVIDKVPEGLEVVTDSINHNGVYDSNKHVITWDLSQDRSDEITVEFTVTVPEETHIFKNTAYVSYNASVMDKTNTTYHKVVKPQVPPTGIDDEPLNIVIFTLISVVLVISSVMAAIMIKRSGGAIRKYFRKSFAVPHDGKKSN